MVSPSIENDEHIIIEDKANILSNQTDIESILFREIKSSVNFLKSSEISHNSFKRSIIVKSTSGFQSSELPFLRSSGFLFEFKNSVNTKIPYFRKLPCISQNM